MLPRTAESTLLLERAERVLRGQDLRRLLATPRALTGFEAGARASLAVALAERAVEKLREGHEPHPAELEALEAGLRLARPALRVMGGKLPESPALRVAADRRASLEEALPEIGLIGWAGGIGFATGFLVSPRVLVTNRHVADYLARFEVSLTSGHFLAWLDDRDRDQPRWDAGIPIGGVLQLHPTEDIAFLELAQPAPAAGRVRLSREPALRVGSPVVAVGYPLFDARSPHCVDALFENVYSVKRASPGEITSVDGARFYHDCSTLCGSSGSPILDCQSGQVIGVHASGQFAYRNTAVSTAAIHAQPDLRSHIRGWV
jgi:S1-C subfamily serine protease